MVTGRQIGGYQILEELGRGAMGVVFKARQISMDRIVAIKFLPKKLAQDERIVARFLREARAAGQLAHPNIVSVHELGLANGLHYIAMEFVDGNSIQKKIKDNGPYTEKETMEIAAQIAEALKMAHARGILHRDIKPDNFLIDNAGRVRLADLGLALIQSNPDGALTQDGTTLGTPHFMSPEQCSGTAIDGRSDLYSLGASMFVMATAKTPYEGTTAAAVMVKVLTEPPISLKKVRPELSNNFVSIVEKLMQKDPAKRFQDAQSAVEALQQCMTGAYKPVGATRPQGLSKTGTAMHTRVGATRSQSGSMPIQSNPEKPGTRAIRKQSRMAPLVMGALAAALLYALFSFMANNKAQPAPTQQAVAPVPVKSVTAVEQHTPVIGLKPVDEAHASADAEPDRRSIYGMQLRELSADFEKGKLKPLEALKKLNEFRHENAKKLANATKLNNFVNRIEAEIQIKLKPIADEWIRVDAIVDEDVKGGHVSDALTKLADFESEYEGSNEAIKAAERVEDVCAGVLAHAERSANAGRLKEARALLTVNAKLPEKQDALFKAASAALSERIKLNQELADYYDRALQKALYFDPVSRTRFQFLDASKFCADSVSKAHNDATKKDLLEMAEIFKEANTIFAALKAKLAAHPAELPALGGYTNVKVTDWNEKGLTFIPDSFKQPQTFTWESSLAPDVLMLVAKETKKAELDKPSGQWDMGVLALALGNNVLAGKYIREFAAKEESGPKALTATAMRLLKPAEAVVAKTSDKEKVEKPKTVAPAGVASLEEDARGSFKELQEAKKSETKEKFKAIRADFEGKYSGTEFVKVHKKEIDDLVAAPMAMTEAPKTIETTKMPEKPKEDGIPPDEKEARDLLKKNGWTEIVGTFVWDKVNNCLRVDGVAEVVNPAQECDVSVRFRLIDSNAKIRVLTRVEKDKDTDRFDNFGGKTSLGFGADVNQEHAYVYMDYKSKMGPVKDPVLYAEVKLEQRPFQTVEMNVHGNKMFVYINSKENKSAGDGRTTGDTRVIVNGPAYLYTCKIANAK